MKSHWLCLRIHFWHVFSCKLYGVFAPQLSQYSKEKPPGCGNMTEAALVCGLEIMIINDSVGRENKGRRLTGEK